jgi:hypothetical protein
MKTHVLFWADVPAGADDAEIESAFEADREAARWQVRIQETIESRGLDYGVRPIDASGNESGDPLDWTDDQVGAALNDFAELLDEERDHSRAERATWSRLYAALTGKEYGGAWSTEDFARVVVRHVEMGERVTELEGVLRVVQRSLVTIDKAIEDDDTAQLGEAILWIANGVSTALAKGER